jgi:hypothetical protein
MSHHPLHPQLASQARRSILPLAALSLTCIMPQAHAGKVLSGSLNTASGRDAVVVSGGENTASGGNSVVVGGVRNTASGPKSIVVAGRGNKAEGANASILSGLGNTAGGSGSSVLTGNVNNSSGEYSSILSGINNIVRVGALRSAVLSGSENVIEDTAINSYIGAGTKNFNAGNRSAILGGSKNIIQANGFNTVVAGVLASSNHANSFVFNSDGTNALATTDDGQFLVNATGGVILNGGTTIQGPLKVSGGLSYEGDDGNIIEVEGPQGETGLRGPKGDTGVAGQDGVGIANANINAEGNLILTLSDGSTINAGSVEGGGGGGPTLEASLDGAGLLWASSGDSLWFSQTTTTYDDVDAVQSGYIGNDSETILQTTVSGPGEVSFRWKVDSEEEYDFLRFKIDGLTQNSISGTSDWLLQTYTLGAGIHVLSWSYEKDESESSGADAGYLDEVAFVTGDGDVLPLNLMVGSTIAWQNPYYNETISSEVVSYDAQAKSGTADAEIKDEDPDDADRSLSYIFEYSFEDDFDVIEYREIGVVSTDQEALDHLNNIISDPTNPITVAINAYITEPSPENDQLLDDAIFAANLNYALEVTDNDEIFIHIGGEVRVEAFSTTGTQRIYGPQIRLNSGNTAFEFVGGGYVGVTTTISNFVVVEVPQ